MIRRYATSIWLMSFCTALVGCSSVEEPVVEMTPVVAEQAPAETPPVTPAVEAPHEPDLAANQPPPVAEFSPPFPERLELFEPPKRARSAVRREDEPGETVELKGFIHVGEPLAILEIDGVIASVAEGGEKYGVKVLSIQPPSVIWQRGRNRRTSTLE